VRGSSEHAPHDKGATVRHFIRLDAPRWPRGAGGIRAKSGLPVTLPRWRSRRRTERAAGTSPVAWATLEVDTTTPIDGASNSFLADYAAITPSTNHARAPSTSPAFTHHRLVCFYFDYNSGGTPSPSPARWPRGSLTRTGRRFESGM